MHFIIQLIICLISLTCVQIDHCFQSRREYTRFIEFFARNNEALSTVRSKLFVTKIGNSFEMMFSTERKPQSPSTSTNSGRPNMDVKEKAHKSERMPLLANAVASLTSQSTSGDSKGENPQINIIVDESPIQTEQSKFKYLSYWIWKLYDGFFFNFNPKIYERALTILERREEHNKNKQEENKNQLEDRLAKIENMLKNLNIDSKYKNTQFENHSDSIEGTSGINSKARRRSL